MVVLAGISSGLSASAANKGYMVFVLPVSEAFGISRTTVSIVFSIARAGNGPMAAASGWLIDKYGPKPIFFIGSTMTGVGFLLLGRSNNILTFSIVYLALITVGSALAFSNATFALVNNWFDARRAFAMAVYQAVSSIIPAIFIPALAFLIHFKGWDISAMVAGLVILCLVTPITFCLHGTPESQGLLPDGRKTDDRSILPSSEVYGQEGYGLTQAFRTSSYWTLFVGSVCRLTSEAGLAVHFIPILVSKGVEPEMAAVYLGSTLFLVVPLFLCSGWLADRLPKNIVLAATTMFGSGALLVLAAGSDSSLMIYLFLLLFALSETGGSNNWATVGDYFGRKSYGKLRGLVQLGATPGVLIAPIFAGWWFDKTGSYGIPLWCFTGLAVLGGLSYLFMRKPNWTARRTID